MQARSIFGTRGRLGAILAGAAAALAATTQVAALSPAAAQTPIKPPNCAAGAADCFKEIRIVNNTDKTIYPIIQGSRQLTEALGNCPQGDIWLQRALNDTTQCFKVNSDYYAYVNPTTGIKKGETASVLVPWWSKMDKSRRPNADLYMDWWRGGRIYFFDDQNALNDSYKVNASRKGEPVAYADKSPQVKCNDGAKFKNVCLTSELKVVRVQDTVLGSAVNNKSPFQLNEWTFADVLSVSNGGILNSLNLNYNVSNVDQLYLPVAMEPIKPGFDVGYMGSIMPVADWRARLVKFTGANASLTNASKWPIYNNPVDPKTKKKRYPDAGIRVPSALAAINFYMEPAYIDGNLKQPEMIPLPAPYERAALPSGIRNILTNWENCTTAPYKNCPLKDWYAPIKTSFDKSYAAYLDKCWDPKKSPGWMKPGSDGLPKAETYMRFVQGWVPFRVDQVAGKACTPADVPDLPQTGQPPSQLGYAPVNYMKLQYDWDQLNAKGGQIFNPYTQLMHGAVDAGFLNTSAYAFSIDDHESFQNHPGTGLIFAIGGSDGLPNKSKVPSRLPPYYEWYTAGLTLGDEKGGTGWKAYGLCKEEADTLFPSKTGIMIGLNPGTTPSPCTITLLDEKNRKYQVKVLNFSTKGKMPYQIWPQFRPSGAVTFDPNVLVCPNPNDDWCKYTNEVAQRVDSEKPNKAPTFTLSTRAPK
ncbi:hypothetical protein V5F53_04155 [Xanthobacter sp. V4C-4]|uniref:hypothetical protein n=1 Tax=Xanthobacter cornucopiae TaxID=3119924 RepID=UPI003729B67D